MFFLAGNLATTGSESFTISSTGVVKVDGTFPTNVKLSINRNTGFFGGTFDFPRMVGGTTVNSPIKYRGAVFQSGSNSLGYGYFLSPLTDGTGASGSVQLTPN
jgi:acetamidase/formamidase